MEPPRRSLPSSGNGEHFEGYLCAFGSGKGGSLYCYRIFAVLSSYTLAIFRDEHDLVPLRCSMLDANYHVEDTGRQMVNGAVLHTFRLYSAYDYTQEIALGANSSQEAAEWMKALISAPGKLIRQLLNLWSLGSTNKCLNHDPDAKTLFLISSILEGTSGQQQINCRNQAANGDENSNNALLFQFTLKKESKWKLAHCKNGLRFFEEINVLAYKHKLPVRRAVGIVKAQASEIFDLIMSYNDDRFQWDHAVESGSVLQVVDRHCDIIHLCLRQFSRWFQPRDFCLFRRWEHHENGIYSIFYRSIPQHTTRNGHLRALIRNGGYIITPLKASASGRPCSLVESVLDMDDGSTLLFESHSRYLQDKLLSTIAGLREYFAARRVPSSFMTRELLRQLPSSPSLLYSQPVSVYTDADLDDFVDARMEQLSDCSENLPEYIRSNREDASGMPNGLSGIAAGCEHLSQFKGSIHRGPLLDGRNCCSEPDNREFYLRGANFFADGLLTPAGTPIFQLLAVDWFKANNKVGHVASRDESIMQKTSMEKDLFYFVFNLQVAHGSFYYSLIFYFVTNTGVHQEPILQKFISGDEAFCREKLALLPAVPEGSWIVKKAVGSRAVLLGSILQYNYYKGRNYVEIDVDMGSSGIVRRVMSIVFGFISALVVDMAFFLRADSEDELPERLLGVVRCSRLDLNAAVSPFSIE